MLYDGPETARENITEKQARFILKKDDEERRKWGMYLYGIDTKDSSLYDVVLVSIETTLALEEQVTEEIVQTVKRSEIEVKLDTFKAQAIQIRDEIGDKITPQAMEKFEHKVEALSKKYAAPRRKSQ